MEFPPFRHRPLFGPMELRLLTILPDEPHAVIKGKIDHVDIGSSPRYECLSYAWGAGDRNGRIMLNDRSFVVSSTLQVALKHLRRPTEERRMWIDAICINQSDAVERSKQVAIMREIYQNAARVIVWIGPATESSEKAMAFLKTMAASKKWWDRNHWINGERLGSDTSSELGGGETPSAFRTEDQPLEEGPESLPDSPISFSPLSEPNETSPVLPPLPDSPNSLSPLSEPDETSPFLPPLPALNNDLDHGYKKLSIWQTLRLYFHKFVDFCKTRYETIKHGSASKKPRWQVYEEAWNFMNATQSDHIVTGFPVLYENDNYTFFENEWESHWQALDELLARPWWGRAWVVQEIWNATDALLQCGTTTIKWKTFEKAMDYSEAWDDMGDLMKGTNREAVWGTLRRRYTLAIHLAKARMKSSTLSSLLWNTWDRASTDARDKVFAIQALVSDTEDIMAPDYTKSMEQLYREVARYIIVNQGQMDILLAASGVNNSPGLPSWVPDWRCEAYAKKPTLLVNRHLMMRLTFSGSIDAVVLKGHGYYAAGPSEPVARFNEDLSVLTVLAKKVDAIAEIGGADIDDFEDNEEGNDCYMRESLDFVLRSTFISAKMKLSEEAAISRVADKPNASAMLVALAGGYMPSFLTQKRSLTVRNTMGKRRLFVSRKGYIGIGPADAQIGDFVCVISGCNFPIVLSPRNDQFAVVGEAYRMYLEVTLMMKWHLTSAVDKFMNGEVLNRPWYTSWMPLWQTVQLI